MMLLIKWIAILTTLNGCFCQDNYAQILQQAFLTSTNAQTALQSGNIMTFLSTFLESNQDKILNYLRESLITFLEETASNSTSNVCLNHTGLFLGALTRGEDWALRMIDAFGKPVPGLLDYKLKWPGSFEECTAITATVYANPVTKLGPEHPYTGKYCTAALQSGDQTSALMTPPGIYIGMCLPDSCSPDDGAALVNAVIASIPLNVTIPKAKMTCQEKSLEFTDKALAVTIVGSVFAAVILIATAYDVFIQQVLTKQGSKHEKEEGCQLKAINGIDNNAYNHTTSKEDLSKESLSNGDVKVVVNGNTPNGVVTMQEKDLKPNYQPGIPGRLLLSFSVYSNAPKILNTSQPKGTLTCVNGIRFLSISWVILGHTYAFGVGMADNIATFLPQMLKRFTFQAIINATVSVDTFFVLSGLLVSYLSLREMKKRGGALKFNWLLFYFHRYWRLTPPYMLVLMLYVPTFKYWGSGPNWLQSGADFDECKDTWWKNLLYINNVYDSDKQCMGWSWYLANDMQFYVISPIMLIPLYYSSVFGGIACLALLLVNFISAGLISNHYGLGPNIFFNQDIGTGMTEIYFKPWARIGPYVVGFFTGYVLYRTDCKVKMSKLINLAGWVIASAMAMSVLYGLFVPDGTAPDFSTGVSALYNATSRTAWALSVAWVIFACATGYGGPVNTLLSWNGIVPLSRLTYCAYLVHPLVMYLYFYTRKALMHWDDLEVIFIFLGNMCISYAAAFVISLAFESPMMGLEKVLLGRRKNS